MNVLHITPAYKPAIIYGGPTLSISQLCEHQVQVGANVKVFTTTANGKRELPIGIREVGGVEVFYFRRLTGDHTHFSPALIYYLFKKCKEFNVIHIHSWWNLVAVLSVLVCWIRGVKPVLSPRGMLSSYSFKNENTIKKKVIHTLLGRFLLQKTLLHATSQLEWYDAHKIILKWKGFILPNIIDLPSYKFSKKQRGSIFKIIYLSRVHSKKGLEYTFKALSNCSFAYQLDIYGDGDTNYINKLKSLANDLRISDYINWKGWAKGKAKYQALSEADVFILTSYNENFANVVIESLSVGTPVILSNQVGLASFVNEHQLGWVSELDVNNISEVINSSYHSIKVNKPPFDVNASFIKQYFEGKELAKKYLHSY